MSVSSTERVDGLAARLGAWSIAHRSTVIVVWLVLLVSGGFAASSLSGRLSFAFALPGQPAYEVNQQILHRFGNGGDNAPLVVVVTAPRGRSVLSSRGRSQVAAIDGAIEQALPRARLVSDVSSDRSDRSQFVSSDHRTTFALVYPPVDSANSDPYVKALPLLHRALAHRTVLGAHPRVTGQTILSNGGQGGGNSVVVETLIAGVGALIVLAIVFGSLLALLPLLIAAVAIPTTFLAIDGLSYVTTISTLVQNIIALIGLGVAIDYSLLICTRWREERERTDDNRQAVLRATQTAASSVMFSGLTVAISLAAIAVTSVPFLRSIGLAGLLIALISVAVATTLLPVVLDSLGSRLEWPRSRAPARTVSRLWTRIASTVVAHRIVAVVGSLVVLGVLIVPVFSLHLGQPVARATAGTAPAQARQGYEQLARSGLGAGPLRPIEILYRSQSPAAALRGRGIDAVAPGDWQAGALKVADAWTSADASTAAGERALSAVRSVTERSSGTLIGGTLAEDQDFIDALYGPHLVWIVIAIIVITFLVLARALRSVWLPIKALALNALSLAAAFGVLTFLWQQGHLTHVLFSSPATGAITLWVPLAVFALLFGLSMDYEVFILTRINEEYDGDTAAATVRAIGRTGRLVSSGALILCLAFIALGGVPDTDVKILSTGLAAGIIIDATLVRGVLAPALVALVGRYNWAMPQVVARLLRTPAVRDRSKLPN